MTSEYDAEKFKIEAVRSINRNNLELANAYATLSLVSQLKELTDTLKTSIKLEHGDFYED